MPDREDDAPSGPSSSPTSSYALDFAARMPVGLCAKPRRGALLPEHYPLAFPAPLAYFPLTANDLGGWKARAFVLAWPRF